jgi:hypothetical protein
VQTKTEKNIDVELLFFFLAFSILSFCLYIVRHPILLLWHNETYIKALISAYFLDLIIFLSIFIPYILIIMFLIAYKIAKNINLKDNIFVILFFPILSFFSKGMSLLQVYIYSEWWEIVKDNFAFFTFLLVGPLIVILNKFLRFVNNLVNSRKKIVEK